MSSIGKLMKQAARMQQQMEVIQSQLAARTVTSNSGDGMVTVTARCDGNLESIKINPQALNPADPTLLEDLLLVAVNRALTQAREVANTEMGRVTGGLGLPGMM